MFKVSQSRINKWQECRHKYHYRYVMNLEPKKKPVPLWRGSLIHDMIEAHLEKQDPWDVWDRYMEELPKLPDDLIDEFKDTGGGVYDLMHMYFSYYKPDPLRYIKFQGRRSEWPFELELTRGIVLSGRIDTMARTKDRRVALVEHKSHKQIPVGDFKLTDLQSGLYCWAAPKVGLPKPDMVVWDYIRAKTPARPDLLKSGEGLSRRANIDTTWSVYRQAIKDHGFKVADYQDMRLTLEGRESSFLSRPHVPISDRFLANLIKETISVAKEMKLKHGTRSERNFGKHCNWCEFALPCRAGLLGHDTKFILKANYKERE